MAKVGSPQWTGKRPAVLAVVLSHMPSSDLLNDSYDNVCDEAFACDSSLAAVVALPFGNACDGPVVYRPANPQGFQCLPEDAASVLTKAFRFYLGVPWRFQRRMVNEIRDARKREGTWPGWRNARLVCPPPHRKDAALKKEKGMVI